MRGHTNNVSCVLFHPKHELIVSNSEDRTIRVWDISKRMGVQTFRRENDRFWILAAHPDQNLLAAGHDSGMIVFKLERERPAFDSLANRCFYIKDRYLRVHEYSSGKDLPLVSLRRASTNNTPGIGGGPRVLVYNTLNKTENNVLIQSDAEGGSYELITFSTEATSSGDAQDVRRGNGLAATFIARDRFVVLDKSKQLLVKNFQNEVIKRYTPAIAGLDNLFYCGTSGRAILKSDDRVVLYDFQARKNIAELQVPRVKYVIWNQDYSMVALISKHQIVLANKQFDHLFTISETVRVKSGCWDTAKNIFIYATSNHVKYALPFGDKGIIRTLDIPMYLVRSSGNTIHCIDREGKVRVLEIDITEALFKIALNNNDYGDVMRIVKHSRLCGQSIVSYLQQKGYPEVALHFVNDNKTRFKLALACGNIQVAMNVAHDLDDDAWLQLGIEALRQGNFEVVEMSYQKTKDFERLSFLYLITGNLEKLKKMMKIAEMRSDVMSVLHNSLFLGEVEERVKILEAAGQIPLAYLIAQIYRLEEPATRLANLLPENLDFSNYLKNNPQLLLPPTPIFRCENWPYLALSTSYDPKSIHSNSKYDVEDVKEVAGNWGDDDDIFEDALDTEPAKSKVSKVGSVDAVEGGWKDDDLDLSDDEETQKPVVSEKLSETSFNFPQLGNPLSLTWCADSSHAADHFAAGAVENAIQLLHRQIAASQMSVLKPIASTVFLGSHGYLPGAFHTSSVRQYLSRESAKAQFPSLPFSVSYLLESLKQAYRLFTAAQMEECKSTLESIIRTIPLVSVASKTESDDLKELVGICREYLISLKVKALLDQSTDVSRTLELAAYFTHCNLQSKHLVLALKTAMATAFKNKVSICSYSTVSSFVTFSFPRRILRMLLPLHIDCWIYPKCLANRMLN
jgi:coatomer protein complex subunit alpha (xenin)